MYQTLPGEMTITVSISQHKLSDSSSQALPAGMVAYFPCWAHPRAFSSWESSRSQFLWNNQPSENLHSHGNLERIHRIHILFMASSVKVCAFEGGDIVPLARSSRKHYTATRRGVSMERLSKIGQGTSMWSSEGMGNDARTVLRISLNLS